MFRIPVDVPKRTVSPVTGNAARKDASTRGTAGGAPPPRRRRWGSRGEDVVRPRRFDAAPALEDLEPVQRVRRVERPGDLDAIEDLAEGDGERGGRPRPRRQEATRG